MKTKLFIIKFIFLTLLGISFSCSGNKESEKNKTEQNNVNPKSVPNEMTDAAKKKADQKVKQLADAAKKKADQKAKELADAAKRKADQKAKELADVAKKEADQNRSVK